VLTHTDLIAVTEKRLRDPFAVDEGTACRPKVSELKPHLVDMDPGVTSRHAPPGYHDIIARDGADCRLLPDHEELVTRVITL
jgi:hypothetical protein